MAAITTLSSLAVDAFKSGVKIFQGRLTGSLVSMLNSYITKINEVVVRFNLGTMDRLVIPDNAGGLYGGSGGAGATFDGVNPGTIKAFRIQDQTGGAYVTVTYDSTGGAHGVNRFVITP